MQVLDDFAAWMDRHYAPNYTRTCVSTAKKLLKALGAKISSDDFKELVTLPKQRSFNDDKVNAEQIRRIVLALKHHGLKVLLMLMKDSQARPYEILGLQLQHFNLNYEPAYFAIPAERAKSDVPRECFFSNETKEMLTAYLHNASITTDEQYLFLGKGYRPPDDKELQRRIKQVEHQFETYFRNLMLKKEFADLNKPVNKQGKALRYKYHIYSFKKYCFTIVADTLGETAARATKGDREYVLTYYKKSREERAKDYLKVMPKLLVFTPDPSEKTLKQIESAMNSMDDEELRNMLEFCKRNGKGILSE